MDRNVLWFVGISLLANILHRALEWLCVLFAVTNRNLLLYPVFGAYI